MNLTEQQVQVLREYLEGVLKYPSDGLLPEEAQYLLNTLDENKALKERVEELEEFQMRSTGKFVKHIYYEATGKELSDEDCGQMIHDFIHPPMNTKTDKQ